MHKSNIEGTTIPMSFTEHRRNKLSVQRVTAEDITAADLAYADYRQRRRVAQLVEAVQGDKVED